MGRKKIKIEQITNARQRMVCFHKRKRGLLKKAMELVLLTDSYLMITIYDSREKRATTFQSHDIEPEFSRITIDAHEKFRPQDYHKYLFKDDDETIERQYHMLPKKRMEEDAERGLDTLADGEKAFRTFKQSLNLHLAKHIDKLLAAENYNDESLRADESVSQNLSPQKRAKGPAPIAGGAKVGGEVDKEMTGEFACESDGAADASKQPQAERAISNNHLVAGTISDEQRKDVMQAQNQRHRKSQKNFTDRDRESTAIEESKAHEHHPTLPGILEKFESRRSNGMAESLRASSQGIQAARDAKQSKEDEDGEEIEIAAKEDLPQVMMIRQKTQSNHGDALTFEAPTQRLKEKRAEKQQSKNATKEARQTIAVEDWSSCGPSGRGSDELVQQQQIQQQQQQAQRLKQQLGVSGLNPMQFGAMFPFGASPFAAAAAFNPMYSMVTNDVLMQQQAAFYQSMLQHQQQSQQQSNIYSPGHSRQYSQANGFNRHKSNQTHQSFATQFPSGFNHNIPAMDPTLNPYMNPMMNLYMQQPNFALNLQNKGKSSFRSSSNPPSTRQYMTSDSKSASNEKLQYNAYKATSQQIQTLRDLGLSSTQIQEILNNQAQQYSQLSRGMIPDRESHGNEMQAMGQSRQSNSVVLPQGMSMAEPPHKFNSVTQVTHKQPPTQQPQPQSSNNIGDDLQKRDEYLDNFFLQQPRVRDSPNMAAMRSSGVVNQQQPSPAPKSQTNLQQQQPLQPQQHQQHLQHPQPQQIQQQQQKMTSPQHQKQAMVLNGDQSQSRQAQQQKQMQAQNLQLHQKPMSIPRYPTQLISSNSQNMIAQPASQTQSGLGKLSQSYKSNSFVVTGGNANDGHANVGSGAQGAAGHYMAGGGGPKTSFPGVTNLGRATGQRDGQQQQPMSILQQLGMNTKASVAPQAGLMRSNSSVSNNPSSKLFSQPPCILNPKISGGVGTCQAPALPKDESVQNSNPSNPFFDTDAVQLFERASSGLGSCFVSQQQKREKTCDQLLDFLNNVDAEKGKSSIAQSASEPRGGGGANNSASEMLEQMKNLVNNALNNSSGEQQANKKSDDADSKHATSMLSNYFAPTQQKLNSADQGSKGGGGTGNVGSQQESKGLPQQQQQQQLSFNPHETENFLMQADALMIDQSAVRQMSPQQQIAGNSVAETDQNGNLYQLDKQAVLQKVYKVGDQEYLLLKVAGRQNELKALQHPLTVGQPLPKLKSERDYLHAIYQNDKDDNTSIMLSQNNMPEFQRAPSFPISAGRSQQKSFVGAMQPQPQQNLHQSRSQRERMQLPLTSERSQTSKQVTFGEEDQSDQRSKGV